MTTKIKSGVISDNAITSAHISSGAISSAHLTSIDTDNITEGSSNLYFTTARARTSFSITDSGGDGSLAYDNSTGVITYTGPSASEVRAHISVTDSGGDGSLAYSNGVITYTGPSASEVRAHLSAGTGVTYSSGEFSIGQSVATTASPTFADINITGDLNLTGDINSYSVTDLDIVDQTITLGVGQSESASDGSGIVIAGSSASILWDEPNDEFDFNKGINVTGNITGTLATAAQPNITSLGTLTAITSTGAIKTDYSDEISLDYTPSAGSYYKGMSGRNQSTSTARGLHIFNYDNDSNEGINFWVGTNASKVFAARIDSSGDVGIGTDDIGTNSKLDVFGGAVQIINDAASLEGSTADASLHIKGAEPTQDRLTQMSSVGTSKRALNLIASTDSSGNDQWWSWGVDTDDEFKILHGTSFSDSLSGIRVQNTGNLLMGNSLYFNNATDSSSIVNTSGSLYLNSDNSMYLRTYDGSWQNRIVIEDGGNVGIGTTPYTGTRVHITGDDTTPSLNTTAIDDCTLVLSNSDDAYGTVFATIATGEGLIQQRRTASAVYYNLLLQPYGSNVGIGTTTINETLEVKGAIGFQASNSTNRWSAYTYTDNTFRLNYNGVGADEIIIKYPNATNATTLLVDAEEQRIGVRTTSPLKPLHIQGTAPTSVGTPDADTMILLDHDGDQYIEFRTTGADTGTMQGNLFTDNGVVGFIGYKQYTAIGVNGNYGESIHIGLRDFSGSDQYSGIYLGNTAADVADGVNSPHMFIKSGGNVGIGTVTPDYTIDVNSGTDIVVGRFQSSLGGAGNRAIIQLKANGNASNGLQLTTCGSTSSVEGGANVVSIMNTENTAMRLGTNNTEAIVIDSSQNVNLKRLAINSAGSATTFIPDGSGLNRVDLMIRSYTSGEKHGQVIACDNNGEAHLYMVDTANSSGNSSIGSASGGWGLNIYYDGLSNYPYNLRTGSSGTWTQREKISFSGTREFMNSDLQHNDSYKSVQWKWVTTPYYWYAATTGQTSTSIAYNGFTTNGNSTMPSNVKALYVTYYYHIGGYGTGSAGQGDHASDIWGPDAPAGTTSWSFTTSGNYDWGSAVFMHDGDASESGDMLYYGAWYPGAIIPVNANGSIYGLLGHGHSGGTHYHHMYVWGYAT
mgnify:CR=1 FL=1